MTRSDLQGALIIAVYLIAAVATGIYASNRYAVVIPKDKEIVGFLAGVLWPGYWVGRGLDSVINNSPICAEGEPQCRPSQEQRR